MGVYYPRLYTPSSTNKFYHDVSYNPFATAEYCMPNCTCYAYGRFSEIIGSRASLPTGNAGTWWTSVGSTYSRSQEPQVGAVMCWGHSTRAGHVGIVEKVLRDSNNKVKSVLCSQSSYGKAHNGTYFWTQTLTPPSYTNYLGNNYIFQGFILNPAVINNKCKPITDGTGGVSKVTINPVTTTTGSTAGKTQVLGAGEAFMYIAESKADDPNAHAWVQQVIPSIGNQAWCAAFVSACAKTAKVDGKAIGISNSCQGIKDRTSQLGGQVIDGPMLGNTSFIPKRGDLALFCWGSSGYGYDHIGIVTGYSTNPLTLNTVEGNTSNGCHKMRYTLTGSKPYSSLYSVRTYVRPNWNAVGGIMVDVGSCSFYDKYGFVYTLYDTTNSKKDAIIREVGYLDTEMKPSIVPSNIKLSLINHTIMYSGLIQLLSSNGSLASSFQNAISDSSVSTKSTATYGSTETFIDDRLATVPRTIYEFLVNKGLSTSVACGIMANVWDASGYKTDAQADFYDGKYHAFGIFQWKENSDTMIKRVPDWATNLSGQLEFFWEQMSSWMQYRDLLEFCKKMKNNTVREAILTAETLCTEFEPPSDISVHREKRHKEAVKIFGTLIKMITVDGQLNSSEVS